MPSAILPVVGRMSTYTDTMLANLNNLLPLAVSATPVAVEARTAAGEIVAGYRVGWWPGGWRAGWPGWGFRAAVLVHRAGCFVRYGSSGAGSSCI